MADHKRIEDEQAAVPESIRADGKHFQGASSDGPNEDSALLEAARESYAHTPAPSDGLEEVVLGDEWDGNPTGARVRVDPLRAKWLRDTGKEMTAGVVAKERSASPKAQKPKRSLPIAKPGETAAEPEKES